MAGPNQIPGPTAIRSATLDIKNHQTVLTQLKETTETASRLRGNPAQSYVTLGELINAGIVKFLGDVVSPGDKIANGGGSGTVHVLDSITGDGSTGTPLQLSGDSASPGNTMLYGTNGSGTKGWYAQPSGGGGSLTVTDGTNSVAATTHLQFSGATVSGTTPNATVTISGGGSTAPPGTISDLILWWETDDIFGTAGFPVSRLRERTPWISGQIGSATSTPATVDSTPINSHPVIAFGSTGAPYTLNYPQATLSGFTAFVVARATGLSQRAFFGGSTNSLALYLDPPSTTNQLTLFNSGVAALGQATIAWTSGTAFQANVTYDPSSGAFAFRQARSANGSGVGTTGLGAGTLEWIGADFNSSTSMLKNCSVAVIIIYNRVLSPTEITSIENYLFAKWGV